MSYLFGEPQYDSTPASYLVWSLVWAVHTVTRNESFRASDRRGQYLGMTAPQSHGRCFQARIRKVIAVASRGEGVFSRGRG